MSRDDRRVVITGAGAVSPFGAGLAALVEGVLSGRTAVTGVATRGATRRAPLTARVADPIGPGPFPATAWRRLDRCSRMAVMAAAEALDPTMAQGALGPAAPAAASPALDRGDLGVVLGSMTSGVNPLREFVTTLFRDGPDAVSPMVFPFTVPNAPASQCSILLGLKGPNLTVCQMEASGLGAIATAASLIRDGAATAILAGGADEVSEILLDAWMRLRVVARGGAGAAELRGAGDYRGPLDRRRAGFAPGEGAYVLLLESLGSARRRGAAAWAEIAGAAIVHGRGTAHGWPERPEDPARAAALALTRAGERAADLGYIAAAANGTERLDRIESEALRQACGNDLRRVPVSAVKGALGESSAAGAAAAVVAALAIRDGFIPPSAALADPDPECDLNVILGEPRHAPIRSALVNALGTGGTCVSLVLTRPRGESA